MDEAQTKPDPLDQTLFVLSDEDWKAFVRHLDNPPPPTQALIELMRRKPVWDK